MSITETTSDTAQAQATAIVAAVWPSLLAEDAPSGANLRKLCDLIAAAIDAEREACAEIAAAAFNDARDPDNWELPSDLIPYRYAYGHAAVEITQRIRARGGAGGAE